MNRSKRARSKARLARSPEWGRIGRSEDRIDVGQAFQPDILPSAGQRQAGKPDLQTRNESRGST
jgi:hypothetical protein